MSDLIPLESFKQRLEGIKSEHSARVDKAVHALEQKTKEAKEKQDKFIAGKQRLAQRIQEIGRAKREEAAGKKPAVYSFGPEDDSEPVDEVEKEVQRYLREAEVRKAAAEVPKDGSFLVQSSAPQAPKGWGQPPAEPQQRGAHPQPWNQPQPWGNQQPQPRGGQQEPPTQPFAQQPPSWQQPAQQPPARGRRAAPPPPDDDDMSGQTWLS